MPVPELDAFRQKYPDYGDMSDIDLAQGLAAKYPEYADLPGKVRASEATPAATFTRTAVPPEQKSLPQYIGEEVTGGIKQAAHPSTVPYLGSETIGAYSPTARNVIGSVLGAGRAAYAVPTAIGKRYVRDPLLQAPSGLEAYSPKRIEVMKEFAPAGYEALSKITPEGKAAAAELMGNVAAMGLSGVGTAAAKAPSVFLRAPGRLLDPLATSGNMAQQLKDAL